ncbi:hypothetical protein, partial [Bacteroides acidifaciens]|uniref:hypothetical protein n=4 Tax=Bacteroides acidifaciens TaxID=85831 RepID=UPI001C9E3700
QILLDMTKPWLGKVGALFIQKRGCIVSTHPLAFFAEMEGDRIFVRSDPSDGFCTVRICFCERSDCRVTTATFYEVHYSFFVNLHFGHFSHTLII